MPRTPRCQVGVIEDDASAGKDWSGRAHGVELGFDGGEGVGFGGAAGLIEAVYFSASACARPGSP